MSSETTALFVIRPRTIEGNGLMAKKDTRPTHHETVTVPRGTPLAVVLSNRLLLFWNHTGHASGMLASACSSRLELYSAFMPDVVAEKMKKPLNIDGQMRR
jgi:hypothetical protein